MMLVAYIPQKNLLLLSTSKLGSYIISENQNVLKVIKISKKFPSTLIIELAPRVNEFLIQNSVSNYFSLSTDGLVQNKIYPNASGSLPSDLVLIKLNKEQRYIVLLYE